MGLLFLLHIRKMLTMLEPHTALFAALTGVGKTCLALDLLEHVHFNNFDCVVILCTTMLLFSDTLLHTGIKSGFGLILTSF